MRDLRRRSVPVTINKTKQVSFKADGGQPFKDAPSQTKPLMK
jgi:hypothetical protein